MAAVDVLRRGIGLAFRGARRGNPALTGVGAALAAIGLVRRMARPKRELLWAKTLKPGESYRIRVVGSEQVIDVEG
jgi:hypothetical protein